MSRPKCECEKPGYFRSGIPGILAHVEAGKLLSKVERCDLCKRFATDETAREYLLSKLSRLIQGKEKGVTNAEQDCQAQARGKSRCGMALSSALPFPKKRESVLRPLRLLRKVGDHS